jgi:hypothetical protein
MLDKIMLHPPMVHRRPWPAAARWRTGAQGALRSASQRASTRSPMGHGAWKGGAGAARGAAGGGRQRRPKTAGVAQKVRRCRPTWVCVRRRAGEGERGRELGLAFMVSRTAIGSPNNGGYHPTLNNNNNNNNNNKQSNPQLQTTPHMAAARGKERPMAQKASGAQQTAGPGAPRANLRLARRAGTAPRKPPPRSRAWRPLGRVPASLEGPSPSREAPPRSRPLSTRSAVPAPPTGTLNALTHRGRPRSPPHRSSNTAWGSDLGHVISSVYNTM